MKEKVYKWLPIIFGCHCKEERSFHFKNGASFPICARCTGELVGMFLLLVTYWFWSPTNIVCFIFCIPMLVDGFIQLLTSYESNNTKRFLTGLLFGYSFFCLIFHSFSYAYQLGSIFGKKI